MASTKPVESALDLLGRRWALRLVWELRRSTLAFSDLRERTGISPSVLSARLRQLARAGVVERDGGGRYRLSGRGRELARVLYELNRWAEQHHQTARALARPRTILAGVSSPELSVVCRSCGEEVSPYVTECPYCGTRIRKRAPKLERHGDELTPRQSRRTRRRIARAQRTDRLAERPYAVLAAILIP